MSHIVTVTVEAYLLRCTICGECVCTTDVDAGFRFRACHEHGQGRQGWGQR